MARSSDTFGGWRHRASVFYVLIVIFALPLFSVPCQKSLCSSPVEVVASSLLANGAPHAVVKMLLYPGLTFSKIEAIVSDNDPFALPAWDDVLKQTNMTVKRHVLHSFGIEIGCYLCVIGVLFAAFGVTLVSGCGMLIVLYYIYVLGGAESNIFALPMFALAMFCAVGGWLNFSGFFKGSGTAKEVDASIESHAPKESDKNALLKSKKRR